MNLQQIIDKDHKYYMNTFGDRIPVCFTYGEGLYLYDSEGKKYGDLIGGIAVNVLGHGNKALAEAISKQAASLIHCSNLFYIENQTLLAERLVKLSPGMDRAFFANSGAEVIEGAIKLARAYFYKKQAPRAKIITALNSFHGRTLAAITATGQEKYNKAYAPLPAGFVHIPYNDISALEAQVDSDTCAVILEIIQGESGVISASADFCKAASDLCRKHGALLIIDEIQTGMGRTGSFFAYEHYGLSPDIVTLAKGLAGGFPIGALLATEKVASAFAPGDHGTTFGGNPLACAAALAVLDEYDRMSLVSRASDMGTYFLDNLYKIRISSGKISTVRGKGLMIAFIVADGKAADLRNGLLVKGWLVNSIGSSIIRLLPPLTITMQDIDAFCADLEDLL